MYVPPDLEALTGEWTGAGKLWFARGAPEAEFTASARISLEARASVLCLSYGWAYQGEPHEGLLVIGVSAERSSIEASWVDSWHMPDRIMQCSGLLDPEQPLSVAGAYEVPLGPAWGWRIAIEVLGSNAWQLLMYNISPDGPEDLAFELGFEEL